MFHPKGLVKPYMEGRAYSTPNESPLLARALYLTPRGSPVPSRVSHLSEKFQDSLTLTFDTDALVAKIGAMFPTVTETHIKILLKKYYNREAVVISALQVEKHPITTPGPLAMSPSVARLQKGVVGVYSALQLAKGSSSTQITPLTGTPQGSPSLLRPASGASSYYGARSVDGQAPRVHPSPKMKLRYLKSVFPKAEETLILDVLANKDNNVQKASEELLSMGFVKKEAAVTSPPKQREKEAQPPPRKEVNIMRTAEEKAQLKEKLQKKYETIAERVVAIALESVDFNEERAEQILSVVVQEDGTARPKETPSKELVQATNETRVRPIIVAAHRTEKSYKSAYTGAASGPNPELRKGPNDSLLLEDYVTWNGPNPDFTNGATVKAEGPSRAQGPSGRARGSIYRQLNKKLANMCVR